MTTLMAYVALVAVSFAAMLGNYWFTFGLWPKSWGAFFAFAAVNLVLKLVFDAVWKETKK